MEQEKCEHGGQRIGDFNLGDIPCEALKKGIAFRYNGFTLCKTTECPYEKQSEKANIDPEGEREELGKDGYPVCLVDGNVHGLEKIIPSKNSMS